MKREVCLRIRGLMPERLIERARELNIRFQSIEPRGDHEILVGLSAADAEKLAALCKRFSIPCEVVSRRGRSAVVNALKKRWTVLIGILIAVIACRMFLSRVWRVDIRFIGDSATPGDAAEIGALLHQIGIRPGASRAIDTRLLSEELSTRHGHLSYVGARMEGVRLLVEVAQETAVPEVYDLSAERDLYADRGGIVESINVESGVPCVKRGDTVRRGQLLIRGEEKRSSEEVRGIAALGEVVIRTWFEGSAEGALYVERSEYTGRTSVSATLITPWLDIPITEGDSFDRETSDTDSLPIGGLFLPVRIERINHRETRVHREKADRASLEGRLGALAVADARSQLVESGLREYEITRCWTRVHPITDDTLRVSAVCEVQTNTAVTIEALHQGG